jgi:hypothetical protein
MGDPALPPIDVDYIFVQTVGQQPRKSCASVLGHSCLESTAGHGIGSGSIMPGFLRKNRGSMDLHGADVQCVVGRGRRTNLCTSVDRGPAKSQNVKSTQQDWAEAMLDRYSVVPNANQWAIDPIAVRLSPKVLDLVQSKILEKRSKR